MIRLTIEIEETLDKVKMNVTGVGAGTGHEIALAQLIVSCAEDCHQLMAASMGEKSNLTHKHELIRPMNNPHTS